MRLIVEEKIRELEGIAIQTMENRIGDPEIIENRTAM